MPWIPKQSNNFSHTLSALQISAIAGSLLLVSVSAICRAEDNDFEYDYSASLAEIEGQLRDLNETVHNISNDALDSRFQQLVQDYHVLYESSFNSANGFAINPHHLMRLLGLPISHDGPATADRLIIDNKAEGFGNAYDAIANALGAIAVHTIAGNYIGSGGADDRYATSYFNALGFSNNNFRVVYSNIWDTLPLRYRINSLGSYEIGAPHVLSNGYVNLSGNTRVPDSNSVNNVQANLYWLMRQAAEQERFNHWLQAGGLFSNIGPDAYLNNRTDLADARAKGAFTIQYGMNPDNFPENIVPGEFEKGGDLPLSLAQYLSLLSIQNSVPFSYDSFFGDQQYQDPGYTYFVNNLHDNSYPNVDDPTYNPDGTYTNLPLLYFEDSFYPAPYNQAGIMPDVDQYKAYLLIKMVNRLSLLTFAVTNGLYSSSTNDTPFEAFGVGLDAQGNPTNIVETNEVSLAIFSDETVASITDSLAAKDTELSKSLISISNTTDKLQKKIEDFYHTENATLDVSVPPLINGADNYHFQFDLPEIKKGTFLGNCRLFFYWFYHFWFYLSLLLILRREYYVILNALGLHATIPDSKFYLPSPVFGSDGDSPPSSQSDPLND